MSTQAGRTAAPLRAITQPEVAWACPGGGEHQEDAPAGQETSPPHQGAAGGHLLPTGQI